MAATATLLVLASLLVAITTDAPPVASVAHPRRHQGQPTPAGLARDRKAGMNQPETHPRNEIALLCTPLVCSPLSDSHVRGVRRRGRGVQTRSQHSKHAESIKGEGGGSGGGGVPPTPAEGADTTVGSPEAPNTTHAPLRSGARPKVESLGGPLTQLGFCTRAGVGRTLLVVRCTGRAVPRNTARAPLASSKYPPRSHLTQRHPTMYPLCTHHCR
jgi:hypothetical protein